ncbi:hypothetical protein C8R44DRAFT_985743, partial [Mycena epipterygia]
MRILERGVHELRMDALCAHLAGRSDLGIFVPTISMQQCQCLFRVVTTLLDGELLTFEPHALLMSDAKLAGFAGGEGEIQFPHVVFSRDWTRVAILGHGLRHQGLEERRDYSTPCTTLLDSVTMVGPTNRPRNLGIRDRAGEACRPYRQFGEIQELDNEWGICFAVFQKIAKQLLQLTALDLQCLAEPPQLISEVSTLRFQVILLPSCTYQSGRQVIYIANFALWLTVISAKRRVVLKGSDGLDYRYLLKGHEDLRQDERVMQLFSLRYPVILLAPRDYRHSIKLLSQHRVTTDAPAATGLREVFVRNGGDGTGQIQNPAAEKYWLERRASYTHLAVTKQVLNAGPQPLGPVLHLLLSGFVNLAVFINTFVYPPL